MLLELTTMKSKYAIFNESGAFLRFESIDDWTDDDTQ